MKEVQKMREDMKVLRSQAGVTLVEVMIGMGLLGSLSLGFMRYQKDLVKSESNNEIKQTLDIIGSQLTDTFASSSICESNLTGAFLGQPINLSPKSETLGKSDYLEIQSPTIYIPDATKVEKYEAYGRALFKVGDTFEDDKIMVDNIIYRIRDVKSTGSTSPAYSATLDIQVDLAHCSKPGPMVRKPAGAGSPVVLCEDPGKIITTKTISKIVRFDEVAGQIKERSTFPVAGGAEAKVLDVACKTDEVPTAADEQLCLMEARWKASTIQVGENDGDTREVFTEGCNYKVHLKRRVKEIDKSESYRMPTGTADRSLKVSMVGGGGGGGRGTKDILGDSPGAGGRAGLYVENFVLPAKVEGHMCSFVLGKGGNSDLPGEETSMQGCGINKIAAMGGTPGMKSAWDAGTSSGNDGENSIWGYGGAGGAGDTPGSPGKFGAGGGGGGEEDAQGGFGGQGYLKLTWLELMIFDASGVPKTPTPTDIEFYGAICSGTMVNGVCITGQADPCPGGTIVSGVCMGGSSQ